MPIAGNISPKARRCLENMAVAGPCTAAELNKLDPTAPDHRQTLKLLEQASYVLAAYKIDNSGPTAYTLTTKARALLQGKSTKAPQEPKADARKRKYAATQYGTGVAAPVTHGSLSTRRMSSPCADMLAPAIRPGAEQALQIPSRVNDFLHYRDGRIVPIHTTA